MQRKLTAAGMSCIIVHAADVSGSDKERRRKTDKVDAVRLARHLAAGLLKAIHVPDVQLQKHRSLIRLRSALTSDLTRCKNRLKALFKFQAIEVPVQFDNSSWSANFSNWIEQQANNDAELRDVILIMLEEVKQLRTLLLTTQKKLRELKNNERYQQQTDLLISAPGIGAVNSMLWAFEIGDVRRFRTFDQLADYVGLCPDSHSSGERERHTGITVRRHKKLRSSLIEASWRAIKKDPALLQRFDELSNRMPKNKAIIRIARKLLRRIRRVLLTGVPYQLGVVT